MATDPALIDILNELRNHSEQLKIIQENMSAQNSWSSFFGYHFTDFIVISLADIVVAVVALVTFESWKERDRQHTERAQRVLAKLGPQMGPLIRFISRVIASPGTNHGTPWGHGSDIGAIFYDQDLKSGSLDWEYPGGGELSDAFVDLVGRAKSFGASIIFSDYAQELMEAAQRVEMIRLRQYEIYASGKTKNTWGRFFKWAKKSSLPAKIPVQ